MKPDAIVTGWHCDAAHAPPRQPWPHAPQFVASLAVFTQVAPQQLPEEHAVPSGATTDPQTCAVHVATRQPPGGVQSAAVEQPPVLELLLDALMELLVVVDELELLLDVLVLDGPPPPVLDVPDVEPPVMPAPWSV